MPSDVRSVDGPTLYGAIAILFVFNSHLEPLYPARWLAGDGLLGNSLFFFLSGWGISTSWRRQQRPFALYLERRVTRIYPTLFAAVLLLEWLPARGWATWTGLDYVERLVYPTEFTYVRVIIPAYVLLYVLLRYVRPTGWLWLGAAAVATYVSLYGAGWGQWQRPGMTLGLVPEPFHALYYSVVILFGASFAAGSTWPRYGRRSVVVALAFTSIYLAFKVWTVLSGSGMYFPVLHVLCFLCLAPLFSLAGSASRALKAHWAIALAAFVGSSTLEIYLVHELLLKLLLEFASPEGFVRQFPLGLVALGLATFCCVALLRKLPWAKRRVIAQRAR